MKLTFVLSCFCFFSNALFSQAGHHNFAIETGFGKNALIIKNSYSQDSSVIHKLVFNDPWYVPFIRFSHEGKIYSFNDSVALKSFQFAGIYTFGGKQMKDGTTDILYFQSLEAGWMPTMEWGNKFHLGIGVKGSLIVDGGLKATGVNPNDPSHQLYMIEKIIFNRFSSADAGIKAMYHWPHLAFGGEAWTSITNISDKTMFTLNRKIYERNFRLTLGYFF
jgi:hypothetical protein